MQDRTAPPATATNLLSCDPRLPRLAFVPSGVVGFCSSSPPGDRTCRASWSTLVQAQPAALTLLPCFPRSLLRSRPKFKGVFGGTDDQNCPQLWMGVDPAASATAPCSGAQQGTSAMLRPPWPTLHRLLGAVWRGSRQRSPLADAAGANLAASASCSRSTSARACHPRDGGPAQTQAAGICHPSPCHSTQGASAAMPGGAGCGSRRGQDGGRAMATDAAREGTGL